MRKSWAYTMIVLGIQGDDLDNKFFLGRLLLWKLKAGKIFFTFRLRVPPAFEGGTDTTRIPLAHL